MERQFARQMEAEASEQNQWRQVQEGEKLPENAEVRVDLNSGISYVRENIEGSSVSAESLELDPAEEASLEGELSGEFEEEEAVNNVVDIREGLSEFAEKGAETEEAEITEKGRDLYSRLHSLFDKAIHRVTDLLKNNDFELAQKEARAFVKEAKQEAEGYFGNQIDNAFAEYEDKLKEAEGTDDKSKKERLLKLAIDGIDFIPVVGPAKMLAESGSGSTFNGEVMSKRRRLFHAAEGAAFLALDLVGVGVLAKGAKAAKLMTRSAALMRKMGISARVYKPVYRLGTLLAKSKMASRIADKVLLHSVSARAVKKVSWARQVPAVLREDMDMETQLAA